MKRLAFTVSFNCNNQDIAKMEAYVKRAVEDCVWQLGDDCHKDVMNTVVQSLNKARGRYAKSKRKSITDLPSDYIGVSSKADPCR